MKETEDQNEDIQRHLTPRLVELGELCGCTELQIRFAEGMLQGMNQSEAALHAGYAGEKGSVAIRSAGSSAARSKPVQALLALAESRGLGIPSAPGDMDELKRILWSIARSKDRMNSIKAATELRRIEEEEKAAQEEEPVSIKDAMEELTAVLGPEIAAVIEAAASGNASPNLEGAVYTWIRHNPQRAKELAEFWLRSSSGIDPNY
jgi:hypothetical protein